LLFSPDLSKIGSKRKSSSFFIYFKLEVCAGSLDFYLMSNGSILENKREIGYKGGYIVFKVCTDSILDS
jgi:hypothetical protein